VTVLHGRRGQHVSVHAILHMHREAITCDPRQTRPPCSSPAFVHGRIVDPAACGYLICASRVIFAPLLFAGSPKKSPTKKVGQTAGQESLVCASCKMHILLGRHRQVVYGLDLPFCSEGPCLCLCPQSSACLSVLLSVRRGMPIVLWLRSLDPSLNPQS
jgi:hypothetical protein